ncbi:exopolysaccharide biosynthesis polyprenyl glycosylphosphotransferase [Actinobacteria bacterium OK074]|nr:exopolysaccharide biosynthesis polyprenyl glycosylphosphotransferase [Actinobacteria bacterium OK074]
MSAESTVPSPGGQPREYGFSSVSVVPQRGAADGFRFPAGRPAAVRRVPRLPLLAVDGCAALLATLVLTQAQRHPLIVVLLLCTALTLNARGGLYRPAAVPAVLDELPALCARTVATWCALGAFEAAFAPAHALSVRALVLGCLVQAAVSCAGRGAVHRHRRRALLRHPGAALVVGPAESARRVSAAFLRDPRCGLRPVGIVDSQAASGGEGPPVLTTGEEVHRALIQNAVRAVLVVSDARRTEHAPLLRALAESGCALWEVDTNSPSYGGGSAPRGERVERLAGFACRRLDRGGRRHGLAGAAKRALDIAVAAVLLLLVSPLLLLCATVLRLTGGRGVVFRQERIGKDGRPFTLLKFRTHRPANLLEAATRWSVAGEEEMSRFCRFLRRSSLDELLQLWNVLRGDMSLVGPRPERPHFVGKFSQTYPGYAARHRMRTGITGLAQVHGLRGDTSIEDRARFDNAYIDDWSLWQDVCILLRTAAALVRPTGS